jgi:hypothetical protein
LRLESVDGLREAWLNGVALHLGMGVGTGPKEVALPIDLGPRNVLELVVDRDALRDVDRSDWGDVSLVFPDG